MVALFALELRSFRSSVIGWARRDLAAQAQLAADNLAEPLRTQDFGRIRAFAEELSGKGLELEVRSRRGGIVFRHAQVPAEAIRESAAVGDLVIELAQSRARILAPCRRSLRGLALAVLAGGCGVVAFFFFAYRQRVRIRELSRLERFRREFVADVSHELKTPLTGIIGAAEMLTADARERPPAEVKLLGMIGRESRRLNRMVQSILDLARLEREGEVLELSEFDLAELCADVCARYRVRFAGGSANGDVVCADARLVEQALVNLVENAKRHSGTDDITVSLRRDGMERVVVEDHGVGIPPEHASRVFERFHRVDPSRSAETGGAGLGLAIVSRIARLHGGEVTLGAVHPHGCRFVFSLVI